MIRLAVLTFCLLYSFLLKAQVTSQETIGVISNKEGDKLAFVTVIGLSANGEFKVSSQSDEDGKYRLPLKEVTQVKFQYVGYLNKIVSSNSKELLQIVLEEDNTVLDGVTVTTKRPIVKRELDRLTFHVDGTPLTTTNAWDIIMQTPGVLVVGDGISIRNSPSVLVTINDKKVMLSSSQLKELLEVTEGTLVESIEVITTPPAKYEAEGNAVLNIKLKKNIELGYKGSLSNRFKQSQYASNSISTNHVYSKNKVNAIANYTFSHGNFVRNNWDDVIYEDGTRWSSEMTRKNKVYGRHSFNTELEVIQDSTISFTFGASGYVNSKTKGKFVIPTVIYSREGIEESNYVTTNDKETSMETFTGYIILDKKWSEEQKLTWSNYFTSDHQKDDQNVFTQLNFKGQEAGENSFISNSNSKTRLFVSALDYVMGDSISKWESGVKYSFVEANYHLDFWNEESGNLEYENTKSSLFQYQESNWAGYASYQKKWLSWQLKAGVRAEYTSIQLDNKDEAHHKRNYLKWFPTFYLMYEIDDSQKLGFSYGKRISRPDYSWMNPAKSYYNLFSYFQGDPNIKPSISHNLSVTYNWNHLDLVLFYNYELAPSMEISYQEEQTKNLIYHYTNIDKRKYGGLQASHPFQLTDWWTGSTFLYLQLQEDYFYGVNNVLYKNDAFIVGGRVYSIFELNKESNWKAMISYGFYTPSVQGTFKISGMQQTNLTMSRDFFNGKVSSSLTINNIFKSDIQTIRTKYANQNNYFRDYSDTQAVLVGLKYNFGNQKVKFEGKDIDLDEKNRI